MSPQHECSYYALCSLSLLTVPTLHLLLLLPGSCASAIHVGIGSIPVNLGRTYPPRNMPARNMPATGHPTDRYASWSVRGRAILHLVGRLRTLRKPKVLRAEQVPDNTLLSCPSGAWDTYHISPRSELYPLIDHRFRNINLPLITLSLTCCLNS